MAPIVAPGAGRGYNYSCHTNGYGALFVYSADVPSIAYRYWADRPVLLDLRPAVRVTTSAKVIRGVLRSRRQ